jgi:UPF0755 protein
MKKIFLLLLFIVLLGAGWAAWKILGPTVKQPEGKYFYVHTGANYDSVLHSLQTEKIINNDTWFNLVARQLKYKTIKPGKYEIKNGMSILGLVRMLRNGQQSPVNFAIVKLRTKEDLARRTGKEFETDSLQMISFLNNSDSLKKFGVDTNTWSTIIIPATYTFKWNTGPSAILEKLHAASEKFWNDDRKLKLANNNLNPTQAYILASIIEEETNKKEDKGKIASVYINRIQKEMPLQADPTIKYALRDFGLKRIYEKYLDVESPYNTYRNKGLPLGPICTPSQETLDEVINAPKSEYIYFVANSDLNGGSVFTTNYDDHMKYAKLYQKALDEQDSIRKARNNQ